MTIIVLQALALERGAARGAPGQDPPAPDVPSAHVRSPTRWNPNME